MHLVDKKDDVIGVRAFLDDALQALLELATVLRAGNKSGQIERPDVLVHEILGHVAGGDLLRKAFYERGLAHTRVAQNEWVVLRAAAQDLHHAADLAPAADHRVELAVACLTGEVRTELLEHGAALARLATSSLTGEEREPRTRTAEAGACHGALILILGDKLVNGLTHRRRRHPETHEDVHGAARGIIDDAQKQVLRRDIGLVVLARMSETAFHDMDDVRREGKLGLPWLSGVLRFIFCRGGRVGHIRRSDVGAGSLV